MAKPVKPRRYESTLRREQAEATRARIVEAAGELFEAQGYGRTTIREIADRAGVAVDTVYATFGTKARVLTALMDRRLTAGSGRASFLDNPDMREVLAETDQRRQIEGFSRAYGRMAERVRPANRILRSAAAVDPDMARVHDEMMGYRRKNWRRVIDRIAANGPLRVPLDRATDILYALASPQLSEILCDSLGWSTEEYAAWLDEMLAYALLEPAARRIRPAARPSRASVRPREPGL